jgi:hypothetical protein
MIINLNTELKNVENIKISHKNYLEYLETCYKNHLGFQISPDNIWYTIICELASHIKENSEEYRALFTNSSEKTLIRVQGYDPNVLELISIIKSLKEIVPTDIDLFLPEFTTSTDLSLMAFMTAFCDAMSPYYNYSMYMCGFRKVEILGTPDDWLKIINHLNLMKNTFPKLIKYFENLIIIIENIHICLLDRVENVDFWNNIFYVKKCGSGSQEIVYGWFNKFYIKPISLRFTCNYPTHVSKVEYLWEPTQQMYKLEVGLTTSELRNDEILIPDYSSTVSRLQ